MSLKWTAFVAQKCYMAVFRLKVHFCRQKSAIKFLYLKIISDKVVRHSLAYLSVLVGTSLLRENLSKTDLPFSKTNADFQSIFARSTSAVTTNDKSSINTNRKSTASFPMSLRWTVHVAPKPPKVAQKRKVAVLRATFKHVQ